MLSSILNIEKGEERPTLLLFIYSFFIGWVVISFETMAFALFFSRFDISSLAYILIATAAITIVIEIINKELEKNFSVSTRLLLTVVFMLLCAVILRIFLAFSDANWIYFGMALTVRVFASLSQIEFWQLASMIFNVRQGKRLFSLISSGEIIAGIIAGLSISFLIRWLGFNNFFLLIILGLALMLFVLLLTLKSYKESFVESREEKESIVIKISELFKTRYILYIFILLSISTVSYGLLEYIFYDQAEAMFPGEIALAGFLGMFYAIQQVLTLINKMFIAGRAMNRFGIPITINLLPIITAIELLVIIIVMGFSNELAFYAWAIFLVTMFMDTLGLAYFDPAVQVLYQPLKNEKSLAVQSMAGNIIEPVGGAIAGLAILAFSTTQVFSVKNFPILFLIVMFLWIFVSILVVKGYKGELLKVLKHRILREMAFSLEDASSIDYIKKKLTGNDVNDIIYALNIFSMEAADLAKPYIPGLLKHEKEAVRIEALAFVERHEIVENLELVKLMMYEDISVKVKEVALRTYSALGNENVIEEVLIFLEDPRKEIKRGVIAGLIKNGGIAGVLLVGEELLRLQESKQIEEKIMLAEILGEIANPAFYQPLIKLLLDSESKVLAAALKAAAQIKNPRLIPYMINLSLSSDVANTAAYAVIQFGENAVPVLRTIFADGSQTEKVRLKILDICGKINGEKAREFLQEHLFSTNVSIRSKAIEALNACKYKASESDSEKIENQIRKEIHEIIYILNFLLALDDEERIIRSALEYEYKERRKRVFLMLSFIYNPNVINDVIYYLEFGNKDDRAYALETLDLLLSKEIKGLVLPMVEDLSYLRLSKRLGKGSPTTVIADVQQFIGEVIEGRVIGVNRWTKSIMIYVAGQRSLKQYMQIIYMAATDRDELVRETALWAMAVMDRDTYNALAVENMRENDVLNLKKYMDVVDSILSGSENMQLMIEKIFILKSVAIFSDIPENVLAAIGSTLEYVEVKKDELIFSKGDLGNSMFIIINGRIRVHDGENTLVLLGERDFFGEMSVLDPEPRSASITAVEDSCLFRLKREALYELMLGYPEIAQGIIQVLCSRLRETNTQIGGKQS
jgi:HEAT repeat protein